MLEGFTTLGHLAALTTRARLGLMVGGIHYRQAGLWLKATTTLDVLSGGRAWFGIGAAWNEEESKALGFPMPPLAERFELLEETLRYVHEGWTGDTGSGAAFKGRHVQAGKVLNAPQALTRPHPPILVGGGGELKTLKLVARYADACNVFGSPDQVRHKYAVLRDHCETEGRAYEAIEKTNLSSIAISPDGARGSHDPERLRRSSGGMGGGGLDAHDRERPERLGREQAGAHRQARDPAHPRARGSPAHSADRGPTRWRALCGAVSCRDQPLAGRAR